MPRKRWALRIGAAAAALLAGVLASIVVNAAPSAWLAIDGSIRFIPAGGAAVDWANSGGATPTYACPAGSVNLSGPGGLFNCGAPSGGSGPPVAPSLTAAAAADPSIISADFIVDPISSDTTTACGAGDPTTFQGGTSFEGSTIPVDAVADGGMGAETGPDNSGLGQACIGQNP